MNADGLAASVGGTFNHATRFVTNPQDNAAIAVFSTDLQPAVEQRVEFYASIPIGATTKPSGYVEWFPFAAPLAPRHCVKHFTGETAASFTLTRDVVLPTGVAIDSAPQISGNFTKLRAIGGNLGISSRTTSTTSAALSGVLHGGSLWDTRQSDAYDPTDLAARSGVSTDGALGVGVDEGLMAIIGPDVNPEFQPALTGVDLDNNEGSALGTVETQWTATTNRRFFSWCAADNTPGAVTVPVEEPSRLAPTGYRVAWNRASGVTAAAVSIYHIYAVGNTLIGGVWGLIIVGEELWLPPSTGSGGPSTAYVYPANRPGALYLGTVFNATSAEVTIWVTPIFTKVGLTGFVGPARVMMYEQVGAGQNVVIQGHVVCEVVAGPALAPFADGMKTVPRMPADFLVALQALYRNPNKIFRRLYSASDYAEAIKATEAGTSDADAAQNPQVAISGRASGFLPGLSSVDAAFRDGETMLGLIDRGTAAAQRFQGIKNRFIPGRAAGALPRIQLPGHTSNIIRPFSALFSPFTPMSRLRGM